MQQFQRVVLIAAASAAIAGATSPPDPDFAPIGGSYGQTVRILVSAVPPDPCSVAVGFRTGEVAPPDPDRTFNLAPGRTAFLDLNLNRLAGKFGVRVEVRPRVVILSGRCSASAEVFEVFTGRTTASMRLFIGATTPPDPNTNPQSPPDPEFAALGAVPGQIVRLGVGRGEGFNTYAPPCRGTLAFVDMQGNIAGSTRAFDLMPGQMAFLDMDPSKVGTLAVAASRVTVRPRVIPPPVSDVVNPVGGSLGGCQTSAQVFESSTGWSTEAIGGAGANPPPEPEFAPLGGSYGQTMRILVSALPPDPCMVTVGFRTGEVAPPDPDRTLTLAPGQTAFHDLNLNRLAGRFGVRVEVTPRVVVMSGHCSAAAEMFEVFSGRTTARMNLFLGAQPPPDPGTNLNPPPEPDFAALGAASGQVVRLGVGRGEGFNTLAPPCRGVLAFVDVQGNIVGSTRSVDLMPGQRAFLDLQFPTPWVRPALIAPPATNIGNTLGGNIGGCLASTQIYEPVTGWSTEAVGGR